jgi:hypothetical protein
MSDNKSKLLSLLPTYYQKSDIINQILLAIESEFKNDQLEQFLEGLLNSDSIKQRVPISKELLQSFDLDSFETYKLSPEDGFLLDNDESVFIDGKNYGPFITKIIANVETKDLAKELIENAAAAGFKYMVNVQETNVAPIQESETSMNHIKGISAAADARRTIDFLENVYWDEHLYFIDGSYESRPLGINQTKSSFANGPIHNGWSEVMTFNNTLYFSEETTTNAETELMQTRRNG